MRSDRYADETVNTDIGEIYASADDLAQIKNLPENEEVEEPRKLFGRKKKNAEDSKAETEGVDLSRMKKKELLEIMLAQGKEIDALRTRVADLEAQLAERDIEFDKIGSLAEAALAVTNIFKEADEAAKVYLMNIRRKYGE